MLMPTSAGAESVQSKISIESQARLDGMFGYGVDVFVRVVCESGTGQGVVTVTLQQAYPEAPADITSSGSRNVPCDGQTHETSIFVTAAGVNQFDVGKAFATAVLSASSGNASDARYITIA
jgi:hypothetical protein